MAQALKVGVEHNLKAGTVKSWCGGWSKQPSTPDVKLMNGTKRGYLKQDPDKEQFTITASGDEQSEIRWPDGTRTAVPNTWIVPVK